MNKAELLQQVAQLSSMTKSDAEKILDATLETIKKSVKKGQDVKLVGFGTFTRTQRKARNGHNPQTGKIIKISACYAPKFSAGTDFKSYVK